MEDYIMESASILNNSSEVYTEEELYGPKRDNLYIVIPMTVIYVIIFLTGLIGNVSTCVVIAKNKSMHTATNYYLFSLAISDLLLLVSGLPPEIYSIWSRYPYIFGYAFCVLRGLFAETSANATVLTITAFTIERYVAICYPFLSHTMSKLSRVVKLILLIWFVAICFAIPQALQFGITPMVEGAPETVMCHVVNPIIKYSFELSTFLFFVLPMTLITVLYAMIGFRLKSSSTIKRETGGTVKTVPLRAQKLSCRHQQGHSSRRVLKMLVAVVVAFFICWAPFHAQRLVAIHVSFSNNEEDQIRYLKIYEVVTYISGILYFVSTTINPVLYNIMSNKFREAFKETFAKCCGLACVKTGRPQRSYSALSRAAQRCPESTDSGRDEPSIHTHTTLTHKSSIESGISLHPSGKRLNRKLELDRPMVWPRDRSEISLTMIPKGNLDIITPNTRLVAVHVTSPPRSKLHDFFKFLHCVTGVKGTGSLSSFYSTPVKDGPEINKTKDTRLSTDSCNISNSSLKEVEAGMLQDELTAYMEDVKAREFSHFT